MMSLVCCPHCQVRLQVSVDFAGHTLKCPKCHGTFVAPSFEPDEDESFPLLVILGMAIVANAALWLILAIAIGPGISLLLVTLVILAELAVWKRNELMAVIQKVLQSESAKNLAEKTVSHVRSGTDTVRNHLSQSGRPSARGEIVTAEIIDEGDDLVEIRPAKAVKSRPHTASQKTHHLEEYDRPPMWGQRSGRPLDTNVPRDNIYFYGPGTELDLGRGVLKWPLVYVTGAANHGRFDASLIDTTLPVAPAGSRVEEALPYWPNYYDCSPAQRAHYIDWLLSGKCNPDTELGYVFIYFYGLERRILVDQADHLPISQELIRLLPIYGRSNSFRRYASTLLWLTLYLASQSLDVPHSLLDEAVAATERWNDDLLGMCLAVLYNSKRLLPAHVAFLVSQNDSRSSSSVIVRRHREEFERLFGAKYREHFGDGLQLRASKREKQIHFHPASGTLLRSLGTSDEVKLPTIPDVLGISSQFKKIVQSWGESIEDLKAYSRAIRSSGGELSSEAYEALPAELQEGDHPETDAWMKAWEAYVDDDGWPIVPVSALAQMKDIPSRDRLTKSQCATILRTADAIGLGVEPDARITGKGYRWDESVTLFFLEGEAIDDETNYTAASVLLRLGASIAEADGRVDEDELSLITDHLEGQFDLSGGDSKRLERLQYLLLHSQSGDNSIGKALAKRLSRQQRLLVGEFLVGVAAVDEVITNAELKALRKAYRSLDLDVAELDKLIARHVTSEAGEAISPSRGDELRLDMQTISRIMTETREVAGILRNAIADDDEPEDVSPGLSSQRATATEVAARPSTSPTSASDVIKDDVDLEARYRPFLDTVITRKHWTQAELREVADECQVMMSGAIEAINEWSTERFGDWLIEEDEDYHVRKDLITEAT